MGSSHSTIIVDKVPVEICKAQELLQLTVKLTFHQEVLQECWMCCMVAEIVSRETNTNLLSMCLGTPLNQALEHSWIVSKAKRHDQVFAMARGRVEDRLPLVPSVVRTRW